MKQFHAVCFGPWGRSRVSHVLWTLFLLAALFSATTAFARDYHVANFEDIVHIDRNGKARITEQITLVFRGEYHGITRDIPLEYPNQAGSNYSLFLKVDQITDDSGAQLKYESSKRGGFLHLKIYVPGAVDATRTVKIEYSVPNAIRFFDEYDEFYWNVTGNDWLVPIEHASATVYLPGEGNAQYRVQAFEGVYGASDHARSNIEGDVATFESTGSLPMRGGLTLDISLPKGTVSQPGALTKAGWFIRSNPIVTLPIWAFAVMFALWWFVGRDPDPGISVAPMYGPPEKMGPAEVGTLIDDSVDPRDITSVLVDLAVRGFIKIVEVAHKGVFSTSKDYELHLLKDRATWTDLTDYERAMLDKVFAGGQMTLLSDLRNHFYTVIPMLKDEVLGALKAKGMYRVDPESARLYLFAGLLAAAAPYVIAQLMGLARFTDSMGPTIVCGIIALVIVVVIGKQLPATSLKGARTRVQVLGFQEFMNRVDADRLKRMPPDTFEKFLPFAMALGVEHRWAKAFEGIIQNPPTWYASSDGHMFSTLYFVNSIGAMSQQAGSVFVSAPRSSSSGSGFSGGGGGGFSGGGFGGGGGGAF